MSAELAARALSPAAQKLSDRVNSRLLFGAWSFWTLPAAWFAGVRVERLRPDRCETSVPYGWRSQNPFRSTYFAAQAMAAELSTGALGLLAVEDAGVPMSILITGLEASFGKKATARSTFVCEEGDVVFGAIERAKASGQAETFVLHSVGRMLDGEGAGQEVSRFAFTWSVKVKRR